jgi:hypothetical protein
MKKSAYQLKKSPTHHGTTDKQQEKFKCLSDKLTVI